MNPAAAPSCVALPRVWRVVPRGRRVRQEGAAAAAAAGDARPRGGPDGPPSGRRRSTCSFTVPDDELRRQGAGRPRSVEVLALTGEPVDVNGEQPRRAPPCASEADGHRQDRRSRRRRRPSPRTSASKREKAEMDARQATGAPPPPPRRRPIPRPKQGESVTHRRDADARRAANAVRPAASASRCRRRSAVVKDDEPTRCRVMPQEVAPLAARLLVAGAQSKKGRLGPAVGTRRRCRSATCRRRRPPPPVLTLRRDTAITRDVGRRRRARGCRSQQAAATRLAAGPAAVPGRDRRTPINVYDAYRCRRGGVPAARGRCPQPLNATPLSTTAFDDARVAVRRRALLRRADGRGRRHASPVESAPSPPACVTPVDTFPPAAPAQPGGGRQRRGDQPDLGAERPRRTSPATSCCAARPAGGPLAALTPAPIRETTYRDTDVRAGKRYVYAVVAVDTATPQNVSAESNRVEETAR